MKPHHILLALILLSPLTLAQEQTSPYRAQELDISVRVAASLLVTARQTDYQLDYLRAQLFYWPKDTQSSTIKDLQTTPRSSKSNNAYVYEWIQPQTGNFEYELTADAHNKNTITPIREKIPFPHSFQDLQEYLQPSEKIDSDHPSIIAQANALAQGEDDYYEVVSKLGIWVKNAITYNLSTMTADVSQSSSWVLENRVGVCDELTSLFIGMLRAIGIPSRFVSGLAYTEDPLFPDNWGSHGWAEVYFPDLGWIPYDPTYGEFGWIDPTHITFQESTSPDDPSVRYQWQGLHVDVSSAPLDIDASITRRGQPSPPLIDIDVKPLHNAVGFGSYNLLQADIKNLNDFYLTVEVQLANVKELTPIDELKKQVILRPNEKRSVFWKTKLTEDLDPKYIYTFPLVVKSVADETGESLFKATHKGAVHDLETITSAQEAIEPDRQKVQSTEIELDCTPDLLRYYPYQANQITCQVRNKGNNVHPSLQVCLQDDCKTLNLPLTATQEASFPLSLEQPGTQSVIITASDETTSKSQALTLDYLDEPDLAIAPIDIPRTVKFSDTFTTAFSVERASYSTPHQVTVHIQLNNYENEYYFTELEGAQNFEITHKGSQLRAGENTLRVSASFEDENGNTYTSTAAYPIELVDVSALQRIFLFFSNIAGRIF